MKNYFSQYKDHLLETIGHIDLQKVAQAADWLQQARDAGKQIFICGNGGSAATASHFVCDILKGASYGRDKRFRIIALTDNTPVLTAYANDISYEQIFVEQLKNFARKDDLVIAISGSGNSPNVLAAVEYAKAIGCRTIALTGKEGGKLGPLAQLNILVPEQHMGRIEDGHMIICHMLGYYFMESF